MRTSSEPDRKQIDKSTLHDISDVHIDTALPQQERIKSFVKQIGNPYCYLDGDIVVTIGYADTDISLQERLKSYISNMG